MLYEPLSKGRFFDAVGEHSKVLLLIDEEEFISYCTYAKYDDIQPTELSPWLGFVYTFPNHRVHGNLGLLIEKVRQIAQNYKVEKVNISTNHIGLYERYGAEFSCIMNDIDGGPSRVYVLKTGSRN